MDVEKIYELYRKNTLYYEYCPPFVTENSIRQDMQALPLDKDFKDTTILFYDIHFRKTDFPFGRTDFHASAAIQSIPYMTTVVFIPKFK